MKRTIALALLAVLGTLSVLAQAPPAGTISRSPSAQTAGNYSSGATDVFTNRDGTTYSAGQLAGQLQSLRAVVDQTLPAINAYTEAVSNSIASGGRSGVVGTLTDILAGALNRNTNSNQGQSSSQGGLAGVLHGLLGTNSTTSGSANATTLRDLTSLQSDLRNIEATLQRLNVNTNSNTPAVLTPTGR